MSSPPFVLPIRADQLVDNLFISLIDSCVTFGLLRPKPIAHPSPNCAHIKYLVENESINVCCYTKDTIFRWDLLCKRYSQRQLSLTNSWQFFRIIDKIIYTFIWVWKLDFV